MTVNGETLKLGRSHIVEGSVPITRFLVSFRREFRVNDPSKVYADRAVIVPNVKEKTHFGSSKDPAPTLDQLKALAE